MGMDLRCPDHRLPRRHHHSFEITLAAHLSKRAGQMAEGDDMVQNREISINWLRINVPQIVAIMSAAMGIAWYSGDKIATLDSRISSIEQSRQARSVVADKNFDDIRMQLQPLATLPYRVDIAEKSLAQTNQRVDQYLQMLGTKIDGVADRVNTLTTKVEVLGQKIDVITPQKKSELGTPPELVR